MGGFFAVASNNDCVIDLFYGTDYHSHLGTKRGGMAVLGNDGRLTRFIHDITNAQFRSKFDTDVSRMKGNLGIGVISDYEDQPLIIGSHLGNYAIVTVGVVQNLSRLMKEAYGKRATHFSEMSGAEVNPTELVATLINQESSFAAGIARAQQVIEGSCSMILLTEEGIYAARDKMGRTPVIIGRKKGAFAATMETSSFPNLDYEVSQYLGPGEIVLITPRGVVRKKAPGKRMQICSFLWVYYGYPSSCYEGINVEVARNKCGAVLARRDSVRPDLVAGIPDSGIAHAIGYANEAGIPFARPFVKYTPTWPRSFMPQDQNRRDLVARMKLIPIPDLIKDRNLLFCEDSIVRGTQLKDIIKRLFESGAKGVHMRAACPPLVFGCKFLNFSRSRSVMDLAARRAIKEIEKTDKPKSLVAYTKPDSQKFCKMTGKICARLNLSTLAYQRLDDLVDSIGLPKEKLCTYCWDGAE